MTQRDAASRQDENIDRSAREWLSLLYAGQPTDADRSRFEAWMNTAPAHREAFARAEAAWSSLGLSSHLADWVNEPVTTNALSQTSNKRVLPLLIGASAMSAAIALLAAPFFVEALKPSTAQHFVAGIGEVKTVSLDDGTVVTLSASSAIDVHYTRSARQIDLVRGSAFFDVASKEDWPLMVDAGQSEVMVAGTAFGVRLGPSDVQVTVSSGRVSIGADIGDDASRHLALTTIRAGELVVADFDGRIILQKDTDLGVALAWMQGQLIYDGATLGDVIADINRYRAKQVEVTDPTVAQIRVTTSFRADQSARFLAGLPAAYPVEIRELPDRTVVEAARLP